MTERSAMNAGPCMLASDHWKVYLKDESNNIDAIGDYSTETGTFSAKITSSGTFVLTRFVMCMAYNAKFDVLQYGTIAGGLANGIRLCIVSEGQTYFLDGGEPIRTNYDWAMLATGGAALQPDESASKNDDGFFGVGLDFRKIAEPIAMKSDDSIQVILNDNLGDGGKMVRHRFSASGYKTNVMPL